MVVLRDADLDEPTHLGPVINAASLERVQGLVQDAVGKGARLLAGGTVDGGRGVQQRRARRPLGRLPDRERDLPRQRLDRARRAADAVRGVKGSGWGRFGGRVALEEFTELRWVTIQEGHRHYPI
jgi:acyl-CoA reductase-like NAD-dependent aldehyde dehydrogenase